MLADKDANLGTNLLRNCTNRERFVGPPGFVRDPRW